MPQSEYELQSNEMQEIIGYIPHWITRWGIFVLFVVLLVTLYISYKVKYPDTLTADVTIQAKEQPGKVEIKRTDASQEYIFLVKEKQIVKRGDTLIINNDTKKKSVEYIITPMEGTIYITQGVDQNNTQDMVLWVVPKVQSFDVKIKYPQKGAGRIKSGQEIIIYIDNYPVDEFGYLNGKINRILPVSLDGNYEAYVLLSKGLVTTRNVSLPIQLTLHGKVEILLNDKSIFSRIFGGLVTKNN